MNIKDFIKGDIIVRTVPNRYGGGELIGKKLEFVGILNGSIYFRVYPDGMTKQLLEEMIESGGEAAEKAKKFIKPQLFDIPLYMYEDNWQIWKDPVKQFGLEEEDPIVPPYRTLQQQLEDALAREDFDEAVRIREQINKGLTNGK